MQRLIVGTLFGKVEVCLLYHGQGSEFFLIKFEDIGVIFKEEKAEYERSGTYSSRFGG